MTTQPTKALETFPNPNPLRELLCGAAAEIRDGTCVLTEEPGLGIPPEIASLGRWAVPH